MRPHPATLQAPPQPAPPAPPPLAARDALLSGLRRNRVGVPPHALVDLALAAAQGAHHGVAQAALAALEARLAQIGGEDLRVADRVAWAPGAWVVRTRRGRGAPRPWSVLVTGLDPLELSCDCDDYLKSSLGACKHGLVVAASLLRDTARRPGSRAARARDALPRLAWDPRRAIEGPGLWLEGLRHRPAGDTDPLGARLRRQAAPRGGWWTPVADAPGSFAPAQGVLADEGARGRLIDALHGVVAGVLRAPAARRCLLLDPALVALLRAEGERASLRRSAERARPAAERALRGLRQRLYAYQREGVRRFLGQGRLLLADDMGLGKTAQAIAACHALLRSGEARRALVVVPASLRAQWAQEWAHFTDVPLGAVEGDADARAATYRARRPGVLLTHYEQLLRDEPAAVAFAPDLLVLDEAQRIKNWATRTAGCVKRVPARWRLVLTGTPFENRLDELASLLDLVDDRALHPLWRLEAWNLDDPTTVEQGRVRGLRTLRERIAGAVLRRSRAEVLGQLPPRTDTRIPIELTEAQREAHEELTAPIARLAATAGRRPLTREEFLRLMSLLTTQRIIANGLAQLEFERRWPALERLGRPDESTLEGLSSPKLLELRPLVRAIVVEQGRKMVVFSQWRRMLQLAAWAVGDVLGDAGLRAVSFTGAESLARRSRSVVEFHDDPRVRLLFATDAGGVGLNLQRAATCAVHLELPWNPAVLEQRTARIHRLGQSRPVDVYALVAQDCIESRIAEVVGAKRAVFDGLFEGTSDEVVFERSGRFAARLARLAGEPPKPGSEDDPVEPPEARAAAAAREEALVEATADDAGPARGPEGSPTAAAPGSPTAEGGRGAPSVPGLAVRRAADGRLEISAPPAEAERLLTLLEGLVGGLRALLPDGGSPR